MTRCCLLSQKKLFEPRDYPCPPTPTAFQTRRCCVFFLLKHDALSEDHGTGSAAANLGGWYVARKAPLPVKRVIHQGEPIARPSRLLLNVDAGGGIYVGGHVIELGTGSVVL